MQSAELHRFLLEDKRQLNETRIGEPTEWIRLIYPIQISRAWSEPTRQVLGPLVVGLHRCQLSRCRSARKRRIVGF